MAYNQIIATTTENCLIESNTGTFCAIKEITTETTYQYFDLILFFLLAIILFWGIAFFKKK